MDNKKIRAVGALVLVVIWAALTGFAWFSPAKEQSEAERRPLLQMPQISGEAIMDGSFMSDFGSASLDQFPLRDTFRSVKALFHKYVLGHTDNNGYFYKDGYLAVQDLTLDQEAVQKKLDALNMVYQNFIAPNQANCYVSIVPDKSYYLSGQYGYPSLDYAQLISTVQKELSWGEYIDITDTLELSDYYRTDTHWRQEALIPTAQKLANAMGVSGPKAEDFTAEKIEKPFYGVYHAQAALPVPADEMYILRSELLDSLKISVDMSYQADIYDRSKLDSDDQYNIYLSGAKTGFVTIDNPNAASEKTLVIFRDSFGSSIAPLFVQDYSKVILIDLRVFSRMSMGMVAENFADADVLVLLSTLAMNNADEAFK